MEVPNKFVPTHLLQPCSAPFFNVQVWGDYPDYVARLLLILEKCNTDKKAIAEILATKSQFSAYELIYKRKQIKELKRC